MASSVRASEDGCESSFSSKLEDTVVGGGGETKEEPDHHHAGAGMTQAGSSRLASLPLLAEDTEKKDILYRLSEEQNWSQFSSTLAEYQERWNLNEEEYGRKNALFSQPTHLVYTLHMNTRSLDGLPIINVESVLHSCVRQSCPPTVLAQLLDSETPSVRLSHGPLLALSDAYGGTPLHEYARVGRDVRILKRLIGMFPLALFMEVRPSGLTPLGLAKRYNSYRNNVDEIRGVLAEATERFTRCLSRPEVSPLPIIERRNAIVRNGSYVTFKSLREKADKITGLATRCYNVYDNRMTIKLCFTRVKKRHDWGNLEQPPPGVDKGLFFAFYVVDLMMNSERQSIAELIIDWSGRADT